MKKLIIIIAGVVVFVAAGIYIDHHSAPISSVPTSSPTTEAVNLQNLGPAPEFTGITNWLNSSPLTLAQLKGKVVLVDFWTYSCINCIRTLPYVTKWYDTYASQGLVVVGVHTPEFDFEKDTANVADAIKRFGIHYPVAQDNNYGTWNAYQNQYWPAEYLIDQKGNVVYTHFGEGEYDHTENAIRQLLGMTANVAPDNGVDLSGVASPEMYFGTARLQYLAPAQTPATQANYTFPSTLALNNFALQGNWQFSPQNITLASGQGSIELKFHASKVHIVAASPTSPATLTIIVDGKAQPSVTVSNSELYTLFSADTPADHIIEIQVTTPNFQAFTFTFS